MLRQTPVPKNNQACVRAGRNEDGPKMWVHEEVTEFSLVVGEQTALRRRSSNPERRVRARSVFRDVRILPVRSGSQHRDATQHPTRDRNGDCRTDRRRRRRRRRRRPRLRRSANFVPPTRVRTLYDCCILGIFFCRNGVLM